MSENNEERVKLTQVFHFKDETKNLLEGEKNKCIRSILWTLQVLIKDKEDFQNARKVTLDSVNDFYRKMETIIDKEM